MRRTEQVQGLRLMKFEEVYARTTSRLLSQAEAAEVLGVSERTFRRWRVRYEADGAEGLYDRRLGRVSARRAPLDEVARVLALAVDRIAAVADAGYFKIEDIEACETTGVVPHVPKPQRGSTVSQGLFPKERFRYDDDEDVYICPNGQRLAPCSMRKRRDIFFASYANRAACKECQLKSKCTKSAFRRVLRYVDEAILERMAERLAARPELLDARRESVEHPFGSIKQWMGQGAFLTRRLENVRGEFSITALAYNIRRAISLIGVPALIAAARA